ncbi:hypothetical protein CS0771_61970 [Catellatospora sp. IY07-71]|nr:hypothetical protein CS0771_61970 [Catellatospora sp. IY07-71]
MNEPSGFATTDCDSVTDSATVTGTPRAFASSDARDSGDNTTSAAAADTGTPSTPNNSRPAVTAPVNRARGRPRPHRLRDIAILSTTFRSGTLTQRHRIRCPRRRPTGRAGPPPIEMS